VLAVAIIDKLLPGVLFLRGVILNPLMHEIRMQFLFELVCRFSFLPPKLVTILLSRLSLQGSVSRNRPASTFAQRSRKGAFFHSSDFWTANDLDRSHRCLPVNIAAIKGTLAIRLQRPQMEGHQEP
jgi:hypothetical protein